MPSIALIALIDLIALIALIALPHDRALVLIDRALPSVGELSSSIGELSNTQKQLYEQLTARETLSTTPSTRRGRGTRVRVRTGMLMTSDGLESARAC
jgi:hypothetical protein